MSLRFKRWVGVLLLAATAFAQTGVSFADCSMDRGRLAQTMAPAAEAPCTMATHVKPDMPRFVNRCLAHCTADLKLAGQPAAIAPSPADRPVLVLARLDRAPFADTGLEVPPPGTPPPRILLHSFLV